MAKYSSKDCVLLIDGYNVLGVTTELTPSVEAMTEEDTALGDEWETHDYIGIQRAELTQNGFFDDASGSINDALNEQQGAERVLCFGIEGNTIGQQFTGFKGAMQSDFVRIASMNGLTKANASYKGSGTVEDGQILHALGAETADGDTESTPVDGGAGNAPSTNGGSGYLQVPALTLGGYTNVVVKVRDSADNITYGDLITFTAVAAAPAAERATVVGDVERYVACSWAFTGAGADPSVTPFVGFKRN